MGKSFAKIFIVILFITAIAAAHFFDVTSYLNLETLKNSLGSLMDFVSKNPIRSALIFIAIYIIITAFSFPGAAVLTLASGALFGIVWGTLFTNIGATIGSIIVFLAARFVFGDKIQEKYVDRLKIINKNIEENAVQYSLTLRLVPVFPFFLVNLLSGLTPIKLRTFIWTTAIGIIPGSFAYAFAGRELSKIDSLSGILSPGLITALIVLSLITFLPVIYKKRKATKNLEAEQKT